MLTSQKTRFNLDSANPAKDIDEQVRAALSSSNSLYNISEQELVALKPNVVLTQSLCEVCSVDLVSVERIVHKHMRDTCQVVDLNPKTLQQVLDDLVRVGEAVGCKQAGLDVQGELQVRVERALGKVVDKKRRPNVFFMEWTDPIFIGGHWTPEIIEMAGGRHLFNRAGEKSVCIKDDEVEPHAADIIIICLCGINLKQTRDMVNVILQQKPGGRGDWFCGLQPYVKKQIVLVDGNEMFNRPGPRLVDCLEWCVDLFQLWDENKPLQLPDNHDNFPAELLF